MTENYKTARNLALADQCWRHAEQHFADICRLADAEHPPDGPGRDWDLVRSVLHMVRGDLFMRQIEREKEPTP